MTTDHGHGPWPCQDPGCPEWSRPSGIERVRLAIRQDRGEFAPSRPLTLCGEPDGTERRADDVGPILDHAPWPGPLHYDFRCRVCSLPVDDHGSILARWRWRRARRRAEA